jgi:hypothetical protein
MREIDDKAERVELSPMFSWLSTQIPEYPDTLSLKMYAHIQEPGMRPHFFLEPADHPLALEYHPWHLAGESERDYVGTYWRR